MVKFKAWGTRPLKHIETIRCSGHNDDPNQGRAKSLHTSTVCRRKFAKIYACPVQSVATRPRCLHIFAGIVSATNLEPLSHIKSHQKPASPKLPPIAQFDPVPHDFSTVRCMRWSHHPMYGYSHPWHMHPGENCAKCTHVPRHPLNAKLSEKNSNTCEVINYVVPQLTCNWQTLLESAWKETETIFGSKRLWMAPPTLLCPLSPSPPLKYNFRPSFHTPCFRKQENTEAALV